ncbi:unnamed protein product [Closterium sp. NIES-64]|nr:unnamed protein product [Closterium sp. NIES-64]
MSIFTFNPSPSPNIAFGPIAFRVPHASPHRLSHTSPRTRPRFHSPSPTLSPIVAHASPYLRSRFLLPSPTLPPTVAHASPHRRPRFPPPSPTLPPTVTHASPHRRPRFPPPSPTLPPTVAHRHRRPPPLSPTLTLPSPSVRLPADLPSLPPLSTPSSLPCPSRSPYSPSRLHPCRPPSHPFPSHLGLSPTLGGEVWRAGLGAGEGVVTCLLWGVEEWWCGFGAECLVHSQGSACRRAARSAVLQGAGLGSGGGGAGEAGVRERGCRDPPIPRSTLIPYHTFTSCPPPSLRSVVPPQSSSSPSPFLPSSISLPHYPLYPLCCPSSLPPFLHLSASLPSLPSLLPVLPSSHPSFLPFFLSSSSLDPPHFFLSSAHHLIRPSSHPTIISSAHHLIRPSSHLPILSSAHHLIRPSSHRRPRFCLSAFPCSLSPTHASSRSPFRPSSVSPLLIFCLSAFFVPHPPSELVVRVCAGMPCIQL